MSMKVTLIQFTAGEGDNNVVTDESLANMAYISKERCTDMQAFGDLATKHGFTNGLAESANGNGWVAYKPATVEW